MEIKILDKIKRETIHSEQRLTETFAVISKLTEAHMNSLPKSGLMGQEDETEKRKSVLRHYGFVHRLSDVLADVGKQRSELVVFSETLDELSSQAEFEDVQLISAVAKIIFELLEKIEEAEKISGRFLGALDQASDATGKGENADFRSASQLCREYFEFITNTASYIDNLKFF